MRRPLDRGCGLWTVGLAISALAGCATGSPPEPPGQVNTGPVDAAPSKADARVDASDDPDDPDASEADAQVDAEPDACAPSCGGRSCGDDGCGGSCGSCDGGKTCTADGQCQLPGGDCAAPRWVAGTAYPVGAVVTEECTEPVPTTACYGKKGVVFAWRCTDSGWSRLRPGSNENGWWTAWAAGQQCN